MEIKMMTLHTAALATVVALTTLSAPIASIAEPAQAPMKAGKMVGKADADGDGKISKAEFVAMSEKRFEKADNDNDGFLSPEEMKAMHAKRKEKFGAMRDKMKALKDKHGE